MRAHPASRPAPITVTCALLLAALLAGCGSGEPCSGESCTPPASEEEETLAPESPSSSASYSGRCCLNGQYYACSTKAAFDLCAGGDPIACHASCAFGDFACQQACDQAAFNAKHDPSQCTRTAAKDGDCATSPTSPTSPTETCVGTHNGQSCSYSTQCPSGRHCANGKCYSNAIGNPCSYSTECGSGNCTDGCCRGTTGGSSCTYSTQCGAGLHCTNGKCYSGAKGNPCSYDTECSSRNCTDGQCQ